MMKLNKPGTAVLAALLLALSACDEGLTELNEDPNAPTDVDAAFILPRAIQSTVEYAGLNTWVTLEFTGLFAQHWAKIQYTEEDRYELRPGIVNDLWT
ncbi:MAG: hypothetical protein ACREM1_08580, partial [Longimicrobiales bacterium]